MNYNYVDDFCIIPCFVMDSCSSYKQLLTVNVVSSYTVL